jgi:hypothetical protein
MVVTSSEDWVQAVLARPTLDSDGASASWNSIKGAADLDNYDVGQQLGQDGASKL